MSSFCNRPRARLQHRSIRNTEYKVPQSPPPFVPREQQRAAESRDIWKVFAVESSPVAALSLSVSSPRRLLCVRGSADPVFLSAALLFLSDLVEPALSSASFPPPGRCPRLSSSVHLHHQNSLCSFLQMLAGPRDARHFTPWSWPFLFYNFNFFGPLCYLPKVWHHLGA